MYAEVLANTELTSSDVLDNPVLASALNIKMEPGTIKQVPTPTRQSAVDKLHETII